MSGAGLGVCAWASGSGCRHDHTHRYPKPKPNCKYKTQISELWLTLPNSPLLHPPIRNTGFILSTSLHSVLQFQQQPGFRAQSREQAAPGCLGSIKALRGHVRSVLDLPACRLRPMCARNPTLLSCPIHSTQYRQPTARRAARQSELQARMQVHSSVDRHMHATHQNSEIF